MPFNHLILCHSLFLLPSVFLNMKVFSNESVLLIRWPKYWSFCFSISSSNEYSGLICFRMDWLDLLAAQEILKSLLQHYNQKPQFFGTQPSLWSNPHICTWLLEKPLLWLEGSLSAVMPLLFNILSRFVIAFLPRSKCLLISWLQAPSTVIWEPKKIKPLTVSILSPSICHEVNYISINLGKKIKWLNLCEFPPS